MSKRANPFADDFVKQSKFYVGIKQFNNNEVRLKLVYGKVEDIKEKTLELLRNGAKKALRADGKCNISCPATKAIKKDSMKQLSINNDGKLTHSAALINSKLTIPNMCKCGSLNEGVCGYCETALCADCTLFCEGCTTSYCSQCLISGQDGVCISCYR